MATSDVVEQVFLGWDRPALLEAVEWLSEHYGRPRGWDLHALTVAVPVTRAGRRLMELLSERSAEGGALTPPRICTVGELPDRLCPPPHGRRIAPDARAMLTRLRVLQAIGRDRLGQVVPYAPAEGDVLGWYRLAERLARLTDELAGAGLSLDDVLAMHHGGGVELSGGGSDARWQALQAIEQAYHELLETDGLIDRQRHRLECLREGRCAGEQAIVLLGAPDLGSLLRAMLEQVAAQGTSVTALIHAPEAHAAGFDAFGALVPEYWQEQDLPFDDRRLRIVDRTTDQPAEVAAAIAAMSEQREAGGGAALAPDQLTVGLADETQGGAIRRALQRAGAPARLAAGRDLGWTPPAMLLSALAGFAEHRRLDAFAELLRHPDVAAYLRHRLDGRDATADWLTLLDDYITQSLRAELAEEVLGEGSRFEALVRAYRTLTALLPDEFDARRPLPELAAPISRALGAFYAQRHFTRHRREDELAIAALQAIGEVLREHAQLAAAHEITPHLTLAEAMRLVLAEARARRIVPEPSGEATVELLGFLDLPLDDAPAVVVTSLNEHHLPATPRGDAFLPDGLRHELGVPDARYRYARDKLLLRAALAGREQVALIAPRRAAEGDPLTPSRLLLACDSATRTARIRRFYDEDVADTAPPRALLAPGPRNRFLIPHPHRLGAGHRRAHETASHREAAPAQPHKHGSDRAHEMLLDTFNVTAFRDYLDCPYRFYLKHVRRLEPRDDRATELDALHFGNVAHEVLEAFANEGPTTSEDPDTITAFLREALDASFRWAFGTRLRPALQIQRQQLQERIEAFAARQARHAAAGWRIAFAEQKLTATLVIDGRPVTLRGKVDRIDVHDDLGHCIIDYKTGDTARKPEQSHRGRVRRTHRPAEEHDLEGWVDLQLPLYLDLVEHVHGLDRRHTHLAQFNLPRKLDEVELHFADWDAELLDEARRVRDWVVRQVCAGHFWPPQEPTGWADAFTWLCADAALDREQLIRDSAAAARGDGNG